LLQSLPLTDLTRLLASRAPLTLAGAPQGFEPLATAMTARALPNSGRTIFVGRDDAYALALADAASYFAPELDVLWFPAWDCLPYDRASPSQRISADRLATLSAMCAPRDASKPQLLVTTVNALVQRVPTRAFVSRLSRRLAPGQQIDRDALVNLLIANGYTRTDTVTEPGEFALRGGLVDVFPAGEKTAIRLDFFGDEIEQMRRFDPQNQRSIDRINGFALLPVTEALLDDTAIKRFRQGYVGEFGAVTGTDPLYQAVSERRRFAGQEHWLPLFHESLETLFDYLGDNDLMLLDSQADTAAAQRFELIADYYDARRTALEQTKSAATQGAPYKPMPPARLYLAQDEWADQLIIRRAHAFSPFPAPDSPAALNFYVTPARDFAPERQAQADNVYVALRDHIAAEQKRGRRVVLVSYSEGARERLAGLLADHDIQDIATPNSWADVATLPKGAVALIVLSLEHGFSTAEMSLLTEQDVLGDRLVRRRKSARKADAFLRELSTLTPGDLVVHLDHGIGRYEGLKTIVVSGAPHDCVALSYADGDKLYVPVENIDVLTRYGSDADGITLDKLGGVAWQSRKAKLKNRIQEIAGELIKVAAERALKEAPAYEPPHGLYEEFCARFPYVETEDQARAVLEVLGDLGAGKPMDRLVCGDVGFGKTEVALRAAFIAAASGVQVAVIGPTTLLARQHYATFSARFAGFPLNVGRLSRLVPAGEAAKTKAGLADGSIDVVVGTHALLAKGLSFKRLGLVIVDEEQHFGVVHKERLKQLRNDVHVLTLTATPIPRTLQMAMSGLRELSLIATPPVDRLAVRTYVSPWDDLVIREALLRERYRGGQSFFVVPRIADLADAEAFLRTHVPEVKAITAHGQMAAGDIEERMSAFYDREYDVLLSTTIVESGLDIPNANTLIIHRADQFGLAQLYQLRGRVGRSKARAYAYLTTSPTKPLTKGAERRLQVLSSLDGLGAGFTLASHDLDIRGAGNLLGDEQSGHIREIGFELYQQMLEEAIVAARATAAGEAAKAESYSPQITVAASIMLPEAYVPDLTLRMGLYRRIGDLAARADIDAFAAELIDRFGPLPDEVQNLLQVIEIKAYCRQAGIAKIEVGPKGALLSFRNDSFENPLGLVDLLNRLKGQAKLRPDHKLVYARAWATTKDQLAGVLQLAKSLARIAAQKVAA
jgi:transcription-repair coupling factor (superfamily II helicase)